MSTQAPAETRDLEADLAICEAATPGPWIYLDDAVYRKVEREMLWVCQMYENDNLKPQNFDNHHANAKFIAAAHAGWPYAIRRTMEAEQEIDRLRNELQVFQEQDHRKRDPWD